MLTLRSGLNGRIWRCICVFEFLLSLANGSSIDSTNLQEEEPIVNTKWGSIHGKWSRTLRDRLVANFLGIPYALPPVGDLRFGSPQRWNNTWTVVRNATVDGNKCIQIDHMTSEVIGSEDCLYLNVFVPHSISDDQQKFVKPVLVFIHGGAYTIGSSDSNLYSPKYLMDQDMILVTINYRLSVLGFFSTTNQASPGNYAIKDTKLALEWVQENIHSFGGNPESVTVMGHGAGAAITHILALSKKTEGLFNKYILLSGSALNPSNLHSRRRYRQVCLKLAKLVGCLSNKDDSTIASNETLNIYDSTAKNILHPDYRDDEEMMKCMRTVDARSLETMTHYFCVWRQHPWCKFGPTLEDESKDAILTMHPLKILKNGLFRDIPAIMQVVKNEGLTKTFELLSPDSYPDLMNQLIEISQEYLPSNTSAFVSALQDFYFKMISDAMTWPLVQAAQYQSKLGNSSIYFSLFAYEHTFSHNFSSDIPIYYGVSHGDDVNYLFPVLPYLYCIYTNYSLQNTESDITMINIMTEMCASFVKSGIPKSGLTPEWPNYRDHHQYMRFGNGRLPETEVQADLLLNRMEFWENLTMNPSAISQIDMF